MDKDYVSIRRLGRFLTQLKGLFVQEVSGKGLSTEDYTTEEKTKLAGIASGAEVNVIEGVQVNGADLTPDANRKVNVVVPENVAHNVSGATSGNFAALNAQGDLTDSGKDASDFGSAADVEAINEKIPTQASSSNQLADKNFVNSSIQTATATFRGIMDCWCALGALGSAPDNNDYAVLKRCNDYIYKFEDDPDEPHNIGDIFGYDGIVYRVVTDFQGSFDETKCEKIGEFALYGGEEPDDGMGVQRYYSYSIEGKTYFRIADWDTENPDGLSPSDPSWIPANWVLIEGTHWSVDTPLATWRWKYTRPSGSGVYAWKAEYKINDAPLTAAQIAALNSNITAALTSKLQGLPSKPVDTAAQTLSDAEKAQARTNIGATAPEVFWAVYRTTTVAQIDAAVAAGKLVMCKDNSGFIYLLVSYDVNSNNIGFLSGYSSATRYVILKRDTGNWIGSSLNLQIVNNLVTSWQPTPDNTHYPAEKLVKDSIDAVDKVFFATYGTTTYAEITAAIAAGKTIFVKWENRILLYTSAIGVNYFFTGITGTDNSTAVYVNDQGVWANTLFEMEKVTNKVSTISSASTNKQYPNAKAVYDFVKALADANNLTMP